MCAPLFLKCLKTRERVPRNYQIGKNEFKKSLDMIRLDDRKNRKKIMFI